MEYQEPGEYDGADLAQRELEDAQYDYLDDEGGWYTDFGGAFDGTNVISDADMGL